MPTLRIHLTNGKTEKVVTLVGTYPDGGLRATERKVKYSVTYCGQTFADFSGRFEHSVYTTNHLQRLLDQGQGKRLCPCCLASDEYALDLLAKDYQ